MIGNINTTKNLMILKNTPAHVPTKTKKKMYFSLFGIHIVLLALVSQLRNCVEATNVEVTFNSTLITFQTFQSCKKYEYYDLDNFSCLPCDKENLKPTPNKFACECYPTVKSVIVSLFDITKEQPTCINVCDDYNNIDMENDTKIDTICRDKEIITSLKNCKYRYINATYPMKMQFPISMPMKTIKVSFNPGELNYNCSICNMVYNFRYKDYCISNSLIKPYLKYNSFLDTASGNSRELFGDLKFIAFFCLSLHNITACNHLANLCVASHFSIDKHSPCTVFRLQSSDAIFKYASLDEEQLITKIKPFLYFKRGKETAQMLNAPNIAFNLGSNGKSKKNKLLQFFSVEFGLDGTLQRWGDFTLQHISFCPSQQHDPQDISFAQPVESVQCTVKLKKLIELALLPKFRHFINLFLNYTDIKGKPKMYLHPIPILIEDISMENQHQQVENWHVVRRFQPITLFPKQHLSHSKISIYDDAYKLQLYRSVRFIEYFHLHYKIYDNNQISIPLIRLRYRSIEIRENSTLNQEYPFKMHVTFSKVNDNSKQNLLNEIILPALLLCAIGATALNTYNFRKRRRTVEICDAVILWEMVLRLFNHTANALVIFVLLHISCNSIGYYTQKTVEFTLPLDKDRNSLETLIGAALVLKLIFLSIHLWRISHYNIFFIDWERPKSFDSNNINFKSNLETSSVCSSVRTFPYDNNVSAWRALFTANEWIRLSCKECSSIWLQGLVFLVIMKVNDISKITYNDITLQLFTVFTSYIIINFAQLIANSILLNRIVGNPFQKFVDICSLANISVFTLLEPSYGFYIHGRSPHCFSDIEMSTMMLQLQRESQNMCGRRGLLNDSDQQTYIIVPPTNLRIYFQQLLIPLQRTCSISQAHVQKEISGVEGNLEKMSMVYNSVNRYLCAFIDHAIKDMDYIIKDKTFLEKLFDCEFDRYLTENRGTFYIDTGNNFITLCLCGNQWQLFVQELLLIMFIYLLTLNVVLAVAIVCLFHTLIKSLFRYWVRENVSTRTLIDKRFLM